MLLGALIISFLLQAEAVPGQQSFDYSLVQQEIQRGELEAAASALEDRLKANRHDFRAHLLLGIVYEEKELAEQALEQFNSARELRPRDPAPYVNMGKTLEAEGKLDAAADQLIEAVRVAPQNAVAHSDLGMLRYRQQRWHESIAELRTAVSLASGDSASWFALFQAYLAAGDFASARQAAARVGRLERPSSEMFRLMGASQAAAGDYSGAIPNLEKAFSATPDSYESAYNLALAWLRDKRPDRAIPLLENLRSRQENAELEDLLGDAYERNNQSLKAVRAFQRAAELDPRSEDDRFDYLAELLAHKSFDAAILIARAAVNNFPDSIRLQLALVAALYGKENYAEAQEILLNASLKFPDSDLPLYLRSAISLATKTPDSGLVPQTQAYLARHPEDALGWLILGRAQAQLGQKNDAIASLSRSLALRENSADAQYEIAEIYFDLKDWPQVVAHASRAVVLRPSMAEAQYHLALALYRLGRKNEADTAMRGFQALRHYQAANPVTTFLYTLRQNGG